MTVTPVFAESGVDSSIPWHYGDPFREQKHLMAGEAVVDVSNREILSVSGPDRLSWLHSLTTAKLDRLQAGQSALALILDPHGHVEHELRITDDGAAALISVEPGTAQALHAYLESMRFMLRVEVAVRPELAAVWTTLADPPAVALRVWEQPAEFTGTGRTESGADRGGDASRYVPRRPALLPGREAVVPRGALADILGEAPNLAGSWALEALRVAAAVPRLGFETDFRTIPHEVGWIGPAVHLAKGCYRGQETIARVHNLGRPPRRLALAHLDGSQETLPEHGDPVAVDGKTVGWVGSVARHFELGPVATVVLKRNVPVEAALVVGGVPAGQQVVVAP